MKIKSISLALSCLLPAVMPASPSYAEALPAPDSSTLHEVIVSSSRVAMPLSQVGSSVTVIDAEEIQQRAYISVVDLLRTQPGVAASSNGGLGQVATVRIRGEEGFRTQVRLDGMKLSDPTGPQVGPRVQHLLASEDISRIEILRGPQGLMYGADAGGVINLFTPRGGDALSGQLSVESGRYGTQQLHGNVGGGNEQMDFYLSATDLSSDGFNTRTADNILKDDDGYDNTTLHGKFGWNLSEALRLQVVARDVDADVEFDNCGFPTSHDCDSNVEQTSWRVSADYKSEHFDHNLAYSNTEMTSDNYAAGTPSYSTDGEIERFEYTGSSDYFSAFTLVYGVDVEQEEIVSGAGSSLERDQQGYFLEYQSSPIDQLFITAGLRYDDNDDFGEHLSYRFTSAYLQDLGSGGTLKYHGSYGTGFRAPSLNELAYNNGPWAWGPAAGFAPDEETSKGFDVGVSYYAASGLELGAIYFNQRIEDEIYFDLINFYGYLQAEGDSQSTGVELFFDYPLAKQWRVFGNATYNDTETPDDVQRIRRPEKIANLGGEFTSADQRFTLLANLRYSAASEDEVYGVGRLDLDDYVVLDISASYQLTKQAEIYGRVENAGNVDYEEVTGYNTGGSGAYAGLRYSF
ncbi:MAG: TonB-dependent receptor [Gammaproteobacteria bacterium]|nr:TonB-dependent receptor [Gammaproteobacteria bacterium]MBQ0841150.1 TonB-dependent receptor [Gammaproteobacteria bacterium]